MTTAAPTKRRRATKTIDSIVGLRPRREGAIYKLAAGFPSLAVDIVQQSKPFVDRAAMSARAIISTPVVDRQGDLLIPSGCRLENYILNPVVLWAHGFKDGVPALALPIGKSQSPDGQLTVIVTPEQVEATCFFSQSNPEAAQIFELIDEEVVRATSVRETPIVSSFQRDPDFGEILLVEEWDLEEWSWCAAGQNPTTVAKTLDIIARNRLDGRPIGPSIMKSLAAICPERSAQGKGFTEETPAVVKKTLAQFKALTEEEQAAAKADGTAPEIPLEDPPKVPPTETLEPDTGKPEPPMEPLGQQIVKAVYASLTDCVKNIEMAMGPLENPAVKEGLQAIMASITEQATAVEGLHSSAYPDAKGLTPDSGEDSEGEVGAMKAFLATGVNPQYQLLGIGHKLKTLCAAKNLQPEQRKLLGELSSHLGGLVGQAKSLKAEQITQAQTAATEALQKRLDALNEKADKLAS